METIGHKSTGRIAVIDVGSNTILMTIAESPQKGVISVIEDLIEYPRLGNTVDETQRLTSIAQQQGLEVFRRYAERIKKLQVSSVIAVGTSALRDASNSNDFTRSIKEICGIEVRIIDGTEEAQLSYAAATSEINNQGVSLVTDVGGNSTEFVFGDSEVPAYAKSLNIGAVRLTNRCLQMDPPTKKELEHLDQEILNALEKIQPSPQPVQMLAVAGTATTLGAIHHGLETYNSQRVHGTVLEASTLENLYHHLTSLTSKDRAQIPGLASKRADIIPAGLRILILSLTHFDLNSMTVTDRGIRHALLCRALGYNYGQELHWVGPSMGR